MRLTTKGRFAVTAMIDVALNAHGGPVALAEVSERQHISLSYLEQLFAKLRRRGAGHTQHQRQRDAGTPSHRAVFARDR